MPASAAAAVAAGKQIKFSKDTVFAFFVIMNIFNQISAPARKRVLLFFFCHLIQVDQTIIAKTSVKCICKK
jgi:hypothetical protein